MTVPTDPGAHYRFTLTKRLTRQDIDEGKASFKVDPYRICDLYAVGGGPREHALKKLLRGNGKGHTEEEMWGEVLTCAKRALEMIGENKS